MASASGSSYNATAQGQNYNFLKQGAEDTWKSDIKNY